MSIETAQTIILGSSGYVGGEMLRMLAHHPHLELGAAFSSSRAGTPISALFPHLAITYGGEEFHALDSLDQLLAGDGPLAAFACAPHGKSAQLLDHVMTRAAALNRTLHIVDMSADFRHPDAGTFERIYDQPHGAPHRIPEFTCALPDLLKSTPPAHVAHPGCFTTAVTLAAAPFIALGLTDGNVFASAVTGSTGSGASPSATTHHPDRFGNLKAYKPLRHRHAPEMERLLGANARVSFVPHTGPFARGIYATLHMHLNMPIEADDLTARVSSFYEGNPFISVAQGPPSLRHVVGTNRCHLGLATSGSDVVVLSTIDNLIKGAAGGAVQWMNRLLGFEETTGLDLPGLGWA